MKRIGSDIIDSDCLLPCKKKYKNVEIREEVVGNETRVIYETKVGSIFETYAGIKSWGDLPFKKDHFIDGVRRRTQKAFGIVKAFQYNQLML